MTLIDRGTGAPIVLVPGVQGRWEWHAPGVEALARRCRVLTFSYADEPDANAPFRPESCLDSYCDQILDALTQARLDRAFVCGVSYGGLVAATFAARHPKRVCGLVLVSALPPTWRADGTTALYLRAPRLFLPVFLTASLRLFLEIRRASPSTARALAVGVRHAWTALTHGFSPTRMARRAAQLDGSSVTGEMASISAPTLVVVGEPSLDRVVPVAATLDYTRLIARTEVATLPRTGHLGMVTTPEAFAGLLASFIEGQANTPQDGRRIG